MTETALDTLLQAAGTALLVVATLAFRHLADWLRLRADDQVRLYLAEALDRAVEFGVAEAARLARLQGRDPSERLPNTATDLAADYAARRVPDALKRFGIDGAGLRQMIGARLPAELRSAA